MNDLVINNITLRDEYASQFFISHAKYFQACANDGSDEFMITSVDFDDFVFSNGYTTCFVQNAAGELIKPGRRDDLWAQFRNDCNRVRSELNASSSYASHGEPAYRLDYTKGVIIVRLLTAMFRVTGPQIAAKLESMITNKGLDFNRITDYIRENIDILPPELRGRVESHKVLFDGVLKRTARDFSDYVEDTKTMYEDAVKAIESDRNIQLRLDGMDTHPTKGDHHA
ncbi:MAG TPA: hypothetical protein ENH92_04325 [Ectothiorhodospiraceae bacterium]|nr:hypothetical protein [Ectothiorhodospiraceae bacterium]